MMSSLTHNAVVHLDGKVVPPHDLQSSRVGAARTIVLILVGKIQYTHTYQNIDRQKCLSLPYILKIKTTYGNTVVPLLVATLNRGHSNKAIIFCYYYQCIYFSLLPPLLPMWPQFLSNRWPY